MRRVQLCKCWSAGGGYGLAPGAHMGPPAIPGRVLPGGVPGRDGGGPPGGSLGMGGGQPPPPHRGSGLAAVPPNPPPYDARHPGPLPGGAKGPVKVRLAHHASRHLRRVKQALAFAIASCGGLWPDIVSPAAVSVVWPAPVPRR